MITSYSPLGEIRYSGEYFATLVGEAAKSCYGVAAMSASGGADAVKRLLWGNDFSAKGVLVTEENGRLVIELHIIVSYGVNISSAAQSITHRVRDEVENATGLKVARVTLAVDDVLG